MQDSYKELLNDSLVIELVDSEVNWIDYHKQINEFCRVKPLGKHYRFTIDNTTFKERVERCNDHDFYLNACCKRHIRFMREYRYWRDKKILIKDISSKHDTIKQYGTYLKNLSLIIRNNRRELNITDNDLQDLRKRRDELTFIANSLDSLIWNDWGRYHEYLGGEYITYTEKGIRPTGLYFSKFNLPKLWSILESYCEVKNLGGDYSHSSATYFITNQGEQVYITAGFLNCLKDIFDLRRSTFDKIIQQLEPITTTPPATAQPTNTKESETDLTDDQKIIYNHIEHLKGDNQNREKIMTDENFNQLFNDLCYLVENNEVPEIKKPLSQIGVSNQSIIYTVRLIHKDLFTTTKIRPSFIEFLQKYFQQLCNMENMQVAFSKRPPKKYPY
jgi:hypothetical protein